MLRFLRSLLPYAWSALILAMLYLLYVGASRFLSSDDAGKISEKRQGLKMESLDTPAPGFRILQFYANAGEITRGEHVVICYGVQDARAVRVDPPVENLEPAANRCFAAEPAQSTTYTLVAESHDGVTDQAAFTVKVKPPAPSFLFVSVSDREVRSGQPVSLCYGMKNASSARLDPVAMKVPTGEKQCVQFYPPMTTKFALVATGEAGHTSHIDFTVKVRP